MNVARVEGAVREWRAVRLSARQSTKLAARPRDAHSAARIPGSRTAARADLHGDHRRRRRRAGSRSRTAPSASTQSRPRGCRAGSARRPSIVVERARVEHPPQRDAPRARAPAAPATGRQRRDGRWPSGNSSSGQVTSTSRPTKLQLSDPRRPLAERRAGVDGLGEHRRQRPQRAERAAAEQREPEPVPGTAPRGSARRAPRRWRTRARAPAARAARNGPTSSPAPSATHDRRGRQRDGDGRGTRPPPAPRGAGGRAPAPRSARRSPASPGARWPWRDHLRSRAGGAGRRASCRSSSVPRAPA